MGATPGVVRRFLTAALMQARSGRVAAPAVCIISAGAAVWYASRTRVLGVPPTETTTAAAWRTFHKMLRRLVSSEQEAAETPQLTEQQQKHEQFLDTVFFLEDLVLGSASRTDLPPTRADGRRAVLSLIVLTREIEVCEALLQEPRLLDLVDHLQQAGESRLAAEILSNLSCCGNTSRALLYVPLVQNLLHEWCHQTEDFQLLLHADKTVRNLHSSKPVYGVDLYPLDPINKMGYSVEGPGSVDVVFVNGLDGSVFHSWRQHDSCGQEDCYTRSWPRDWLATDLPSGTRLLGINVSAKAFIWSMWGGEWIPDTNESQRTLRARATRYLKQLREAGVGANRPVVWITHSMGGLLVKEMLRQDSEDGDSAGGCLCSSTRGVLFMSTPHTGARALRGLHRFPLRYLLTLEARELHQDAAPLHHLHDWFRQYVASAGVRVLSLVETLRTRISPIYYTVLNPEDTTDTDVGSVVRVSSDHTYISKPRDTSDEVYQHLLQFVLDCGSSSSTEDIGI